MGAQQPVRRPSHPVVPDTQLAIDGVAQDELEDVDRLHRGARRTDIPLEQLVRTNDVTAGVTENPLHPGVADESGTHRLDRRHTG